ncbi:O-acetyl-ADP-ribose deacetylase (regulator of RNase III) [Streptomyces sp. V4I8]
MPSGTAMPSEPDGHGPADRVSVDHASVVRDLGVLRRAGIVRLRSLDLPALAQAAAQTGQPSPAAVEQLLRQAAARLDGGSLQEAAAYTLGLTPGTRDWPGADRRRRAAGVYGVSVERLRKFHEPMVLDQVAEQIVQLVQLTGHAPPADPASDTHRALRARAGGRTVPVTLHIHPVDLLRDVDVIVSPANTYFALPEAYKSSVSALLRRAGARRGPTGDLVQDVIRDELREWAAQRHTSGRPVLPGTVAATGSGALAEQGVRRIYHAAVAVPRAGTNDYDVLPADVTRAVARALTMLAEERDRFDPPLRSVCLPLIGSGRGGLSYQQSLHALWAAVEAELARGADWDLHLIVRRAASADLLTRTLTGTLTGDGTAGIRPGSARSATSPPGALEQGGEAGTPNR